jgi:hypothetical protein
MESNVDGIAPQKFFLSITAIIALSATAYILFLNRNLWFYGDDFSFLFHRYFELKKGATLDAVLMPHNEHPAILPALTFLTIESLFGIDERWLFMLPVLTMHIVIIICVSYLLSWTVKSKAMAIAGVCAVAFLSAGYENLLWSFQFGFIGAIAFGLLQLCLIYPKEEVSWRDVLGSVCAVVAVTTQGTGLTILFVVTIFLILQRRWKALVIATAPAIIIFATWRVLYGVSENVSGPTKYQLLELPKYVWRGLTFSADGIFHLAGIGVLLFTALTLFHVFHFRDSRREHLFISLITGVVFFYFLNGMGRVQLGIEQATASRYVYVGIVLLAVPTFSMIEGVFIKKARTVFVFGLILALWSVTVGSMELWQRASEREGFDRQRYDLMSAAVELSGSYAMNLSIAPSPLLEPQISVRDLLQANELGIWVGSTFSRQALLDSASRIVTSIKTLPGSSSLASHDVQSVANSSYMQENKCIYITPISRPQLVIQPKDDIPITLMSKSGGEIEVMLGDIDTSLTSVPAKLNLSPMVQYEISGWIQGSKLILNLSADSETTVCGVIKNP